MKTRRMSGTATPTPPPLPIRFEFHSERAQAVFIAGTFNEWRSDATPMIPLGEGRWVKELVLLPGRYEYRYVVDGEWVSDPLVPEQIPNPHGGHNSVLVVSETPVSR